MSRRTMDDLHQLLSAVVDDTLREDQAAELAKVLAADVDARRFYVRYLDMNAALAGAASRSVPVRGWRVPWVALVASLVAASLLLALPFLSWLRRGGPDRVAPDAAFSEQAAPPTYVGTLESATDDAVLNDGCASSGTRLTVGPYVVSSGEITVRFDGGARVLFSAPSRFTLHSRKTMAIDQGTFVFSGDRLCESIRISTPHSVFRNIGTRYAAIVDSDSEELHVTEGAVRRTAGDGSWPHANEMIEAGVGRRYGPAGDGSAESIPLDQKLVERSLDEAPPNPGGAAATVADDFRGDGDHVKGLGSGHGWAEPWRSRAGRMRLVSPGLAGKDSAAVLHDGSGNDPSMRRSAAHRQLEAPIDLSQDGVWYLRFLVRRGPTVRKDEHQAMVSLRKHGLTPEEELERCTLIQIALRRDDSALVRVADAVTNVSLPQASGHTYAVIAKIVAGRTRPEQVLVRLMAAERLAGSEEPAEWSVVSDSVETDMLLDQLSLECVSRGRIEFGDVLIGPTWQSITAVPATR